LKLPGQIVVPAEHWLHCNINWQCSGGQSPRKFRTRICIREIENRVALDP